MKLTRSAWLIVALSGAVLTAPAPAFAAGARPTASAASAATIAQRLADLAERYYDENARFEPINATFAGDNRFDHLLPMTHAPAVRARRFAMLHDVQQSLMRLDRGKLGGTDLVTFDALGFEVASALSFEPFKDYLLPMNQMDCVPVTVANLGSGQGSQPIATVAQYQAYLKRIEALPQWIDVAIADMRVGMKQGVVQPKALMLALLPQVKALAAATPETSDFSAPVRRFPESFSNVEKARLGAAYRQAVGGAVLPALRKLAVFIETEYLPAARTTSGWGGLPGGAHWYRAWVKAQTTTDMSPEEIHRIGLAEMARIGAEYAKLGLRLGYGGAPLGLPAWLAAQPVSRPFKTEAQVLQAYRALNERIAPRLPQLFAAMPKATLDIRAEPELSRASASDHYTQPAADGSRPGIFWAVIPDPAAYGSTTMTSLFLHEGQPGHHFQLARQLELPVPKFRKLGGNNAYVEGWALYAETLGKEMGLYEDPNAYAGHLMLDMVRAARLVVDTGLHAKGWTREQTIAFLVKQTGTTEAIARNATERYMAWPGQALGYKIGALKIIELRQRAASALGPKFNLGQFHEAVLAEGALPLALLENRVNDWIALVAR
ncbi:MAG: hypothetical protein JWR40_2811 [Massilia sp.]|nr:hypothetical protein [Massilia sp.]MDB5948196.1 hypothetical protein [Massilia sp.]